MRSSFILLLICVILNNTLQLSCQDQQNKDVTLFQIMNLPLKFQTGFQYGYYDSSINQKVFDNYETSLYDDQSALTYTLNQVDSSHDLLVWNDENPNGQTVFDGAHSKGLIAYDSKSDSGFYISHSVPKYPKVSEDNTIDPKADDGQRHYGQSFICLSLNGESLDQLAEGFLITNINAYHTNVKSSNLKNFSKLANKKSQIILVSFLQKSTDQTQVQYQVGDFQFLSVFKNPDAQLDMFEDIMAPAIKQNVVVESWGRPYMASNCSNKYSVKNVKQISWSDSVSYQDTQDHSKWAISAKNDWVCIGDMNHMSTQEKRGGSMHCFENKNLWSCINSNINQIDEC